MDSMHNENSKRIINVLERIDAAKLCILEFPEGSFQQRDSVQALLLLEYILGKLTLVPALNTDTNPC